MIEPITKAEYERLKTKQKLNAGFIDCTPFIGIDNKHYIWKGKGPTAMKGIWRFQKELKQAKTDQQRLLQYEAIKLQ